MYLNALSDLIEIYESRHVDIPQATDAEVLTHLLESNGLKQKDLVEILDVDMSVVSEIIAGERKLTRSQIDKLAARFHVSRDVFL